MTMLTLGFDQAMEEMSSGQFMALIAIVGGLLVGGLVAVFGIVSAMVHKRESESTRREISAYVAEGTMTADDAERLLEAGRRDPDLEVLMGNHGPRRGKRC